MVGGFKHDFYFPFHIRDNPSHWLIFFQMGQMGWNHQPDRHLKLLSGAWPGMMEWMIQNNDYLGLFMIINHPCHPSPYYISISKIILFFFHSWGRWNPDTLDPAKPQRRYLATWGSCSTHSCGWKTIVVGVKLYHFVEVKIPYLYPYYQTSP